MRKHYLMPGTTHFVRIWCARGGKAGKGRTKYAASVDRPSVRNKSRWFPSPEAALLAYELTQGGAYYGRR